MQTGKIITRESLAKYAGTKGDFSIDFNNGTFGPYSYIFQRKNLYFHEDILERGSYFFPLKNKSFKNTEIFIETDDIVVAVGERGSFSGNSRMFVEIINIKTQKKYRFYPDEVSLIYNSKEHIIIYYKKSESYKKLEIEIKTLDKISEELGRVDAFFKILYNYKTEQYINLVYYSNGASPSGFFQEELIDNSPKIIGDISWLNMAHLEEPDGVCTKPERFDRKTFTLITDKYQKIDVWEASLTGKIR